MDIERPVPGPLDEIPGLIEITAVVRSARVEGQNSEGRYDVNLNYSGKLEEIAASMVEDYERGRLLFHGSVSLVLIMGAPYDRTPSSRVFAESLKEIMEGVEMEGKSSEERKEAIVKAFQGTALRRACFRR